MTTPNADPRAQAEQRFAAELERRTRWGPFHEKSEMAAFVTECAKLAAEEIAKQLRMSGLPEDTHRWHLVCADAEKGEKP